MRPKLWKYIKPIAIFIFALVVLVAITSWLGYPLNKGLISGQWVPYFNREYRFALSYPGNWRVSEAVKGNPEIAVLLEDKPLLPTNQSSVTGQIYIDQTSDVTLSEEAAFLWARRLNCQNSSIFCASVEEVPELPLVKYGTHLYPTYTYNFHNSRTDIEVFMKEVYVVRGADILVVAMATTETEFSKLESYFDRIVTSLNYE